MCDGCTNYEKIKTVRTDSMRCHDETFHIYSGALLIFSWCLHSTHADWCKNIYVYTSSPRIKKRSTSTRNGGFTLLSQKDRMFFFCRFLRVSAHAEVEFSPDVCAFRTLTFFFFFVCPGPVHAVSGDGIVRRVDNGTYPGVPGALFHRQRRHPVRGKHVYSAIL